AQQDGPRRGHLAPVQRGCEVATADADQRVLRELEARTGECDLEGGFILCIADQQVGKAMRILVHHPTHRHAKALVAVSAQILQRGENARAMDLQRHRPSWWKCSNSSRVIATKRTRSPAASKLGGSAVGSKKFSGERPIKCQPPGKSRGYTAVSSPPIPTLPAGTRVRGVNLRGVA